MCGFQDQSKLYQYFVLALGCDRFLSSRIVICSMTSLLRNSVACTWNSTGFLTQDHQFFRSGWTFSCQSCILYKVQSYPCFRYYQCRKYRGMGIEIVLCNVASMQTSQYKIMSVQQLLSKYASCSMCRQVNTQLYCYAGISIQQAGYTISMLLYYSECDLPHLS